MVSLEVGGGENVPGIPGTYTTRNFYVTGEKTMDIITFQCSPAGLNPARFHCKVPDGAVPADVIPPDPDNKDTLDHCSHYQNFSADTNVTVKGCPLGWDYSNEIDSFVQEVRV